MSEKRRTYNINFNKGIDKNSLPFEGDPARALDALNYVYRDGRLQKRYGLNQKNANSGAISYVAQGASTVSTNTANVNGIWRFKAEDGNYHIVAHIGKLMFEVTESNGVYSLDVIKNSTATVNGVSYPRCYEFVDYKSVAIIGNNCLWFFGGNRYMKLRYTSENTREFVPVDSDSNTYIPTTTISITEEGSAIAGRASLDAVNLMTEMRINKLLGGTFPEGSVEANSLHHEFSLDAPIISSDQSALSKMEIKARMSDSLAIRSSTYGAIASNSNAPSFNIPTGTNVVLADVVIIDNYGQITENPIMHISTGEPTRAEVLFGEGINAKIRMRFGDRNSVTGVVTVLSTEYVDFNDFIAYSLGTLSFVVSWNSGASLSSYDGEGDVDSLKFDWYGNQIRTTTLYVSTVVHRARGSQAITMKCVELSSSLSFKVTSIGRGNSNAIYLTGIKAIIIASNDNANWLPSFVSNIGNYIGYLTADGTAITYDSTHRIYGYVTSYGDATSNGRIVLFGDWKPLTSGESNIDVKFPCYVSGNANRINKCRIAKLFGNANAKNRLFVSGNPDYPNCDWHSSARNEYLEAENAIKSNGDFSYFSDMDYCFYGQTDNAIMGYDNVATDKMVVLKSKSKVEPTNYFRTSSLIQAIDASGNAVKSIDGSTLYQESFPLATGNIGAGAMNHKSVVNLNGDTLYLSSENTICGLNIAGQVGDSQRISYSRSRYIDPELKDLDLSDAVLWTNNKYLFLFTSEATYVTHYETFTSETGQYEWFKIDVKSATCAIEIDDAIVIGTSDGGLYRFDKDSYRDTKLLSIAVGGTLYAQDKITYNTAYNSFMGDGKNLTFKVKPNNDYSKCLYRNVGNIYYHETDGLGIVVDAAHNCLRIVAIDPGGDFDAERFMQIQEDLAYDGYFFLNKPDGEDSIQTSESSDLQFYYEPYLIKPTSDAEPTYKLYDPTTLEEVDISVLVSANLCRILDSEYEITDLDTENGTFKIRENGRVLDVVLCGNQDMSILSFPSEIRKYSIVKSYFIAAPAVLGGISYRKTIWAWTLTAFREPNDLQVCQATNEEKMEDMRSIAFSDVMPIGFDFGSLSFKAIDFEKSVIPRKYTYIRPLSVPFISFGFKSDAEANSVLTTVSIVYTIPMLGRGDR